MELVQLSVKDLAANIPDPPYRERAVDVPESFVGMVKQQPRYPPPPHLHQQLHQPQVPPPQPRLLPPPVSHSPEPPPKLDLNAVLDRILELIDSDAVKTIAKRIDLSRLISIYDNALQMHQNKLKKDIAANIPTSISDLVHQICALLQEENLGHNHEAEELMGILNSFDNIGLFSVFDRILSNQADVQRKNVNNLNSTSDTEMKQQNYLGASTEALNYPMHPNVKIVQIEKRDCEPLGATARNDPDGSVIIGRIVKGGIADKCGLLKEGDEILEVNGIEMKSRNIHQVCDILAAMRGTLTFVIAPGEISKSPSSDVPQQIIHLKSLFDNDPVDDLYIPCHELGLAFNKGDILHVIDQSDINWWQAYREGEQCSLAGLIPSAHFQLKRMKQAIMQDSGTLTPAIGYGSVNSKKSHSLLLNCGRISRNRKKKSQQCPIDEILVYEEVALYYPTATTKRPIVLIGPTNIGRHELRQKLMQDTQRFSAAVPHTSRPKRYGEINGIDYHFISRQQFEQDIKSGKFVEHGQFEKNYYGTSLEAIESVVNSGKICVLNLHVHSIPILRQGNAGTKLKPYFVFVAPPQQLDRLNKLIHNVCAAHERGNNGNIANDINNLSVAELQAIVDEARDIEARFGHYFDMILTISDVDQAYNDLLREINALEREPQWIPSIWMK